MRIKKQGTSQLSVEKLMSHSSKKHRRGNHLCFRKNRLSKKLTDNEGFHYFLLIVFCLTVPKTFVGKHFCASEKNRLSKKLTENKETLIFSVDKFCLTVPNIVSRNSMDKWGEEGLTLFQSKVFCLTLPKKVVETPFSVFKNFWNRKILGIREGAGITIFRTNCFVSPYRNIS